MCGLARMRRDGEDCRDGQGCAGMGWDGVEWKEWLGMGREDMERDEYGSDG